MGVPGGKRVRGETLMQCCAREIREELDIEIEVGRRLARVEHAYSHFSVTLHFFECRHTAGRPRARGCQAFSWTRSGGMKGLGFLPDTDESSAAAVSANGGVVAGISGGEPFRWTQAGGMQGFGFLPG